MKSREWLSPRTVSIIGILVVLLMIGLYFYVRHDVQKFEASLPKILPTTQSVNRLGHGPLTENVIPKLDEVVFAEKPVQAVPVTSGELIVVSQNEESVAGAEPGCSMSGDMMDSKHEEDDEPEVYAGMTNEEVRELIAELQTSYDITNADEKFDLLGEALLAKIGPDPRIPRVISNFKALHALDKQVKRMNAAGKDNQAEIDVFLNQLPAVVASDLVELSIGLLSPSEEESAALRKQVKQITSYVDNLTLLRETTPLIKDAISTGDITPEEGKVFLESVSGINVTVHALPRSGTPVDDTIRPLETSEPAVKEIPEY